MRPCLVAVPLAAHSQSCTPKSLFIRTITPGLRGSEALAEPYQLEAHEGKIECLARLSLTVRLNDLIKYIIFK